MLIPPTACGQAAAALYAAAEQDALEEHNEETIQTTRTLLVTGASPLVVSFFAIQTTDRLIVGWVKEGCSNGCLVGIPQTEDDLCSSMWALGLDRRSPDCVPL